MGWICSLSSDSISWTCICLYYKLRNNVLVFMLGLEDHMLGVGLGLETLVLVNVLGREASKLTDKSQRVRMFEST